MLLYHYLYVSIPRVKEFNSIITNNVNEKDFSIDTDRFKTVKNTIFIDSINKRTIEIVFNRAIIIGLIILRLKIITRRKEIKLLDLLRKFKISIISKQDKRFLKKAKKTRNVKEIS